MSDLNESRTWETPESDAEALIEELRRELERLNQKVEAFRESRAGDRNGRPE